MKKLTSILLILSLVLSTLIFSSCGGAVNNRTPYEIVDEAITNTENADKISASSSISIAMNAQGISIEMPMSMDVSLDKTNPEAPVFFFDMTTSILGQNIDMKMYCDSTWVYTSAYGQNFKMKMVDMGDEFDITETVGSFAQKLPEEIFADKSMTVNKDGSQTITLNMESDIFSEIFEEVVNFLGENMGSDTSLGEINFTDPTITITARDGYLTNYDIAYLMEMELAGISTSAEIDIKTVYTAYGNDVVIEPLEGYEDFPVFTED